MDPNGDQLSFEPVGTASSLTVGAISVPSCVAQGDGSSVCTATVEVSALASATNATFPYRVTDGVSYSGTAYVDVRNPEPVAIADRLTGVSGPVTATLRGIDPNGDALTIAITTFSGGTVGSVTTPVCTPQGDGSNVCAATAEFTPSGTSGTVNFSVSDGVSSVTASVAIVASTSTPNSAPKAVGDRVVVPASGGTVTLRGTDSNGDSLSFSEYGSVSGMLGTIGAPSCVAQGDGSSVCTAAVTVTPSGSSGSFQFQVSDGLSTSNASVSVTNERPEAVGGRVVLPASGGAVTLRGVDAEGDGLSFSLYGTPSGVSVGTIGAPVCTPQGDGSSVCTAAVTVTPSGSSGSFQFQVSDGLSTSVASVSVTNERPEAVGGRVVLPASGGAVTLRGVDAEGDGLSFSLYGTPAGVSVGTIGAPVCTPQADGRRCVRRR